MLDVYSLVPGDFIEAVGTRYIFVGMRNGFANIVYRNADGKFAIAAVMLESLVEFNACETRGWEEPAPKAILATEDDCGTIVYNQDGNPVHLFAVNYGPKKEFVVGYGGDSLGFEERCFIPDDQAEADRDFESAQQASREFADDQPEQGACCSASCAPSAVDITSDQFVPMLKGLLLAGMVRRQQRAK